MKIFNRVVVILLLVGLFILGLYTLFYAFNLFGYRFSELPVSGIADGLRSFVNDMEEGAIPILVAAGLVVAALVGLILFLLELKPPTPRRVRMQKGTYLSRGAVESEVEKAVDGASGVLGHSTKVEARRGPGAVVNMQANVRRGEDTSAIKSGLRSQIQEHLGRRGIPVGKLNLKLVEADPRQTKTRVQ